ncbi:tetratricopeptide repeat protein [Flavobacterium sp. CYK-55]|uniref:tetratricopeptide repeat-containing sensor histidine kinase n=1 Tax=Flavobacterium sp. CYK-55 TaxID=2835529 RepID=UPI001BCC9151|nr:tetratricopeptide repeat protein [Flavobacterium sp. CYK-55]MBS7785733.1 tetratricopeptide repeat protein [Flavobacterium sp. CYK-55]
MKLRLLLLWMILALASCQKKPIVKNHELTPNQTEIIKRYKKISYIVNTYPDSMAYYADWLERKTRNESVLYKAMAHFAKGIYHQSKSNYELSKKEFEYIIQTVHDTKYDTICGRAYLALGNNYKNTGDYPKAMNYLYKTLKTYEKHHNKYGTSSAYGCMAQIYLQKNDISSAEENLKKAISIMGTDKDNHFYLIFIHTLANVYGMQGNYQAALTLDQEGIRISKKLKMPRNTSTFYDNKANCYMYSNQLDSAAYYFNQCLKIDTEVGEKKQIADTYSNLGALFFYSKDYSKALDYMNKSFALLEEIHNLPNMIRAYDVMADIYKAKGNYVKALELKDKKEAVVEQMISEKKEAALAEFKVAYETEKKEKALAQNRLKLLQKEDEARQKNYWIAASVGLAFFIALIGGLIYRQEKIKNRQQEQEFKLKSAIAQIEAQNQLHEQRLAISRDLHDNIGSQLTFIISSVENLRYAFDIQNPKLDEKLTSIGNFTRETISELRDTIWAMNYHEISIEELESRALNFIEKGKNTHDYIDFLFEVEPTIKQLKLSSLVGVNCYRTIQEAIHNAIKYARASQVNIQITSLSQDEIQIVIADNGIGFDPKTIEKGNGLLNMQKRIENINGVFSIESQPNQGTRIKILLNKNQLV